MAIFIRPTGNTTHNKKAHVPWAAITNHPDKFLDTQYLPDDTTITEISRMRSAPLLLCYRRWFKAQKKGDVAFRFKSVLPEDRRDDAKKRSGGKGSKKRGLDVSEDEETSDEKKLPGKKRVKMATSGKKVEGQQKDPEAGIEMSPEQEPNPVTSTEGPAAANEDKLSSDKPTLTVEEKDHAGPLIPERLACRCYFLYDSLIMCILGRHPSSPASVLPGIDHQIEFLNSLGSDPRYLKLISLVERFPVSLEPYSFD